MPGQRQLRLQQSGSDQAPHGQQRRQQAHQDPPVVEGDLPVLRPLVASQRPPGAPAAAVLLPGQLQPATPANIFWTGISVVM